MISIRYDRIPRVWQTYRDAIPRVKQTCRDAIPRVYFLKGHESSPNKSHVVIGAKFASNFGKPESIAKGALQIYN